MSTITIPTLPNEVIKERVQQSYILGREAQGRGLMEVPAQDITVLALLQGLAVGQGTPILQSWVRGHRHNRDEQQIREFAGQLGLLDSIEERLLAGLSDAGRIALWWELFDQLPDAA